MDDYAGQTEMKAGHFHSAHQLPRLDTLPRFLRRPVRIGLSRLRVCLVFVYDLEVRVYLRSIASTCAMVAEVVVVVVVHGNHVFRMPAVDCCVQQDWLCLIICKMGKCLHCCSYCLHQI